MQPPELLVMVESGRVVKMAVHKNLHISDVRKELNTPINVAKIVGNFHLHLKLLSVYEKLGHLYYPSR